MNGARPSSPAARATRFPANNAGYWAAHYTPSAEEDAIERDLAPAVRARGYLTHAELAALGEWKSLRIRPNLVTNDPAFVEAVTRRRPGPPPPHTP